MSPVAYSRPLTTVNPMAPVANGFPTSSAGGASRKGPYPHINDLTSVAVELDPHTPLRKVLDYGEAHMRQAITYNDFRRPDKALQEYITAFTIAVDKIPKHKDYPSLKNGHGDLSRMYNALKINITTNGALFDRIKEDIKEDNRRSGVQSKNSAVNNSLGLPKVPSNTPSQSKPNGTNGAKPEESPTADLNGVARGSSGLPAASATQKSKPAVQPKPQRLHGNAISQDLTSRFARLRAPQEGSARPAETLPKPAGPRDMPVAKRPQPSIESSVPIMPKLPDAIYSPARGTVTSEVAELPSSTPRGMFSRTNSIVVGSCSSARNSIDAAARPMAAEQFVTSQSSSNGLSPSPVSPRIQIPDGDTVTPEQLREYMQRGTGVVRLLLIDIRSREDFDEGHIMSQGTICIESAVLGRQNITAEDIEESLHIAPDEELQAFRDRGKYDLVVFYDQDTFSMPLRGSPNSQETAVFALYQALVQFNYEGELRSAPKLLAGGVDAWIDVFGQQSLQESRTSVAVRDGQVQPRRVNGFAKPRYGDRRMSRTQTKSLRPEEIKNFEASIKEDEAAVQSPRGYVRSTEEFLRRYPSASEIQESMISPERARSSMPNVLDEHAFLEAELPPVPPARPAPAVPRTSYSGLSSREPTPDVVYAKMGAATTSAFSPLTGLINSGTTCYANSLIQALLGSPGFSREFVREDWPTNWRPSDSKEPQLTARILGNLIQWLSRRQLKSLKPTTLLKYSQSVHAGYADTTGARRRLVFGDSNHHDSAEFMEFLFGLLEVETNRNRKTEATTAARMWQRPRIALEDDPNSANMTLLDMAAESWKLWSSASDSVMDKYWYMSVVEQRRCISCEYAQPEIFDNQMVFKAVKEIQRSAMEGYHLTEVLKESYLKRKRMDDYKCDKCGKRGTTWESSSIARMPRLLCAMFTRFNNQSQKVTTQIGFDLELDLGPFSITRSTTKGKLPCDAAFSGPTGYDLYAVVCHWGQTIHGGHYIAYVRDGPGDQWWKCDDSNMTKVTGDRKLLERWRTNADGFYPFYVMYKRKDTDWEYSYPPPPGQ